MSRVGISRDNFTGRPCFLRNLANQLSPYKALAIIFEDNCIGFLDSVADRVDYFRDLLGRWAENFFAIDTNHLRSEEHTSELQSLRHLVCRLLLEKKK